MTSSPPSDESLNSSVVGLNILMVYGRFLIGLLTAMGWTLVRDSDVTVRRSLVLKENLSTTCSLHKQLFFLFYATLDVTEL